MEWTDDDLRPSRTRDELLSKVTRRGEELRRRRRAGRGLTSVVAVVTAVAIAGLAIGSGDEDPAVQVATEGPSTSAAPEALPEAFPEPIPLVPVEAPPTTSTPDRPPLPTSTSSPSPASPGLPPATTPTAVTATTGPTASTTAPTTPWPAAEKPGCTLEQLGIATAPDKPEFRPGEVVRVTTTLRNQSSTTCYHHGSSFHFNIDNGAGGGLAGGYHEDNFGNTPADPLHPGQTLTETVPWNQSSCSDTGCAQAAPGTYTFTVSWTLAGQTLTANTSFLLVS